MADRISEIQAALRREGISAWAFYNFRHGNPFMDAILGLDVHRVQTRRLMYVIPVEGECVKIVHKIEAGALDALAGSKRMYAGWRDFEAAVCEVLGPCKTVAMEYAPMAAIPTVSMVDAGTIDLVRSARVEVVSSATLVQEFEATWSDEEYASHERAAACLFDCVDAAFAEVRRVVKTTGKADEYDIQQFMCHFMRERGMLFEHDPIVAVNAHSADPHFGPSKTEHEVIWEGDFLLLDVWCKEANRPRAMYADITWTGFVGQDVPEEYQKVFSTVAAARDEASRFIAMAWNEGRRIKGAEVDDVCRAVIERAGFGEYFVHRTGHSIGENVHGNGANIDNLETRDERFLIPRTCFSIEPGIYLPSRFGVRSEIDVYFHPERGPIETGRAKQTKVIPILA